MKKHTFYILHFTFYILLILTISNCSDTTKVSKGSLSGIIKLEGETDHSGIIVALYDLAILDPDIVSINQQYPHIGVIINQHTEFDHRLQEPVKNTETDAEGYFEIKKIPTGIYNIIAIKDSFGFKYIYEFDIEKGDNEITQQITLYSETPYTNQVPTTTFLTDHHYIIDNPYGEVILYNNSLTIQPGAVVRITPNTDFNILGTLTAQGEENNMFWVTTNAGFSESLMPNVSDSLAYYNSFELSSIASVSDDLIEWGKFDYANTCLINYVNNLHMQNGIFRNGNGGFYATSTDSVFCRNLLCKTITNESMAGIYYNFDTNGYIEKNIILNSYNGIITKNSSNPLIDNNYIKGSDIGINTWFYSSPEINYNEIMHCETGIHTYFNCNSLIYKNYFECITGIYIVSNNTELHYNNFNCSEYAIELYIYHAGIGLDTSAENNFFYTMNEEEIQDLIYDENDVDESLQAHIGEVNYIPFLITEVPDAGIQGE